MGEFFCLPSNGYVSLLDSEAKSATTLLIDKKTEAVDTISFSYGLQNIHEVQVSDDNQSFSTKDGVLYTKCKDELIWYPPKKKDEYFEIPEEVKTIRKNAFCSPNLKRIIGGKNLINLDPGFCEAQTRESLKEFCIHGDEYETKNGVLYNKALNTLICSPANCECDLEDNGLTAIAASALFMNHRLSNVVLNDNLERIDVGAFIYSDIVNLVGGFGLRTIGCGAFSYCERLETAVFQDGLRAIEVGAFNHCQKLKELLIPKTVTSIGFSRDFSTISKKTTILCEAGSYAEEYAKEHSLKVSII